MRAICAQGPTVKGIDVSHHEPVIDWVAAKASGIEFAFIKATEGLGYIDAMFHHHWAAAKAAGIIVGAYHFYHEAEDPIAQAQLFARVVGPLAAEDLPCVMDWETDVVGTSIVTNVNAALAFLRTVENLTKRTPLVYSGPYFLQAKGALVGFDRYPLWIAHYGVRCPLVPNPWTNWAFWQAMETFKLPGGTIVDADLFNGTLEQLQGMKWISPASSTPKP